MTAVLAVLFSFIVAKLVSVAMTSDAGAETQAKTGDGAELERGPAVEEVKFEGRLSARGCECQSGVEFVEKAVEQVHWIEAEPIPLHDAKVEETVSEQILVDRQEVPEKSLEAVELVEKSLEEKSGQCCVEELKRGDDESVERNSMESALDQVCVAEFKELKDLKCETEEVKEEISKMDGDDEDDDWEGIEKTELEKDFALAAKFVGSGETDRRMESFGSDLKMQLYGLHKVATEGPCHEPQPMALKVSARAKWYHFFFCTMWIFCLKYSASTFLFLSVNGLRLIPIHLCLASKTKQVKSCK